MRDQLKSCSSGSVQFLPRSNLKLAVFYAVWTYNLQFWMKFIYNQNTFMFQDLVKKGQNLLWFFWPLIVFVMY